MNRLRFLFLAAALVGISFLVSPSAHAAQTSKERGLLISPIRDYLSMDAGTSKIRAVTVANMTSKPMVVTLALQQFSVEGLGYEFQFNEPQNDYIKLVENRITLNPFQSRKVAYRVNLPKSAAPGGMYYTVFASTQPNSDGAGSTIRVASLLYLTVNGDLVQTGDIVNASMPWIVVTPQVPYTIDLKNTGNVHYFAHFSGSVAGAFYNSAPTGTSQLLMPNTTRRIAGSVASPLFPGVYKLNYGYKTDSGMTVNRSHYFLFLPPWFIAFLVIAGYVFGRRYVRRRRTHEPRSTAKPTDS